MREMVLVGVGGFLGAVARYAVSNLTHDFTGRDGFPFGTLVVNIVGSFLLGLLFVLGEARDILTPAFRNLVFVGVIGAFTTFSTFSLETVNLLASGDRTIAFANIAANLLGCLGAIALSRVLVQAAVG